MAIRTKSIWYAKGWCHRINGLAKMDRDMMGCTRAEWAEYVWGWEDAR